MTKKDLCDIEKTNKWISYYESLGYTVLGLNLEKNTNLNNLINLTNDSTILGVYLLKSIIMPPIYILFL